MPYFIQLLLVLIKFWWTFTNNQFLFSLPPSSRNYLKDTIQLFIASSRNTYLL